MACKPYCACKCGHSGCECWDGIAFNKRDVEEVNKIWNDSEKPQST